MLAIILNRRVGILSIKIIPLLLIAMHCNISQILPYTNMNQHKSTENNMRNTMVPSPEVFGHCIAYFAAVLIYQYPT